MFGYVVIFNLRFIFTNENRNPSTASYLVLLVVVVVVVILFVFLLCRPGILLKGTDKSVLEEYFDGVYCSDKFTPAAVNKIVFHVNGVETTVINPDSKMSLNEWIRAQPGLKGN